MWAPDPGTDLNPESLHSRENRNKHQNAGSPGSSSSSGNNRQGLFSPCLKTPTCSASSHSLFSSQGNPLLHTTPRSKTPSYTSENCEPVPVSAHKSKGRVSVCIVSVTRWQHGLEQIMEESII